MVLHKYRFLISGDDKERECFVYADSVGNARIKLAKLIDIDNRKNNRNTKIIRYIGI